MKTMNSINFKTTKTEQLLQVRELNKPIKNINFFIDFSFSTTVQYTSEIEPANIQKKL